MKKLQKYIKWLSLGSVVVLTSTTISCNVNTSSRNIFEIPTSNKRPKTPNSHSNSTNNSTPENSNTQPNNYENNNNSNSNSNQDNNDERSNNETVTPYVENNTETNDTFINNQTYFSTISNLDYNLTSLENNYLKYEDNEFKPLDVNEQNTKELLLNDKLPLSFYSHPKYRQEKQNIFLKPNESIKLKLIDSQKNKEITSGIKWYQRLRYPSSEILTADDDRNDKLKLSNDGIVTGKIHQKENNPTTLVWAEYKGYFYPFFVEVPSEHHFKGETDKEKAREVAKKLAEKWKDLPVLEKLTKAYEWMTKEVKYDPNYKTNSLLKDQTAYSALVEKCTVCTGYAKGFKMIMDELSIPCRVMEGQSTRDFSAARHAWNLVEIDGEWYHVDPTSDRTDTDATFNFFLNSNDDFSSKDSFQRDLGIYGTRFRNYKNKDFVHSKEDVLALIDNQSSENNNKIKSLELTSDNFINVNKALEERNLEIKKFNYLESKLPFKKVKYTIQDKNSTNIKTINVNVKKEEVSDNHLGKYALKITMNSEDKINDLKPKNFNLKNAMVKEAKKVNDGYILFLDHFSAFGDVEVELQSIKRQGYKFNLDQNKFIFNVEKHQKPSVSLKIDTNNRITIIGSKKGMQYRSNLNKWIDITSDNFVINNPSVGKLSIRWADYNNKFASDIQIFEIKKAEEVVNKVKLINHNMLIGLDNSMEYKKEESNTWTKVTSKVLKNLSIGTYLIRTSAFDSTLASDISKVEIK
ncbi:MAG6410 family transglutaminase-related lipoprotein [Mycoplasma capricolum]|uniref:MAG6410 family transglutaminase-related lipoprotein n=1 Tax=Mycoplasma capricolum TaxID=2095 RepID=UPI0022F3A960|nr:transglutaminase domain-containing protein [Mycoplasma capricolum]WBX36156.1 lipoprotein [Mycoplasma capricolum subsp. capricolum]